MFGFIIILVKEGGIHAHKVCTDSTIQLAGRNQKVRPNIDYINNAKIISSYHQRSNQNEDGDTLFFSKAGIWNAPQDACHLPVTRSELPRMSSYHILKQSSSNYTPPPKQLNIELWPNHWQRASHTAYRKILLRCHPILPLTCTIA